MPSQLKPLLWYLMCIVVILGLAYWVTRYLGKHSGGMLVPKSGALPMEILSQLTLSRNEKLLVVRTGKRCFLLGLTEGSIQMLSELSEEDLRNWTEAAQENTAEKTEAFAEKLRALSRKKEQE